MPDWQQKNHEKIRFFCSGYGGQYAPVYPRPDEARQIKIKDIDLKTNKIFISAQVSKNRKEGFVTIPPALNKIIKNSKIFKINKTFLFQSKDEDKPISKNIMTRKHKIIIDKLGFDSDHTLYSWKHTGVVKAYQAGIKIKSIQKQCRHHSLEQTDNYLKSLGLFDNEEFLMMMPEI